MSSLQSSISSQNQQVWFTQALSKFVSKFECSHNISAGGNLHEWRFLLGFENKRKYVFNIQSKVKNGLDCFSLTLSLKQYWDEVMKFGSQKIREMINLFNLRKGQIFIHEFQQSSKLVIIRSNMLRACCEGGMGYQNDQLMQKITHLIQQKMYDCLSIVSLTTVRIGDMLQYQMEDIGKINYSMDMIQMDRISRSKASNIIKVTRLNFYGEKIKNDYQYKDYMKFTNLLATFEEKLKANFSKKNKILRMAKDLQAINDQNWKNDTGSFGVVEKIYAKFMVNSEISINAQTNEQLLKIRRQKNNDEISSEIQINDYTPAQGYLVRKQSKDTHSDSSFYVEKRMLAYMRGERCHSINQFFWIENQKLEDISEIYSEYCAEKIDDRLEKSNTIIKVLLTLLEGLIFFRWNGISHRDLKPQNILKSKDYTAKIIDFGSSCHNKYYRNENNRAKRIFSQKLRTNIHYNLIHAKMDKSAKSNFTQNQYNQHQFFDVYAFGIIVQEFLGTVHVKNQIGEVLWEYFRYVSQLCREQNPDDRPDPRNLYVLFASLIKLSKK